MKIVHVIESLALGGTENQFLALLPELARDHEIVLVTLRPGSDRAAELPVTSRYNLGFTGASSLPRAILRLRRIIATERPDLVRSQHFWSNVTARLATPASVPLVFSIHSKMSADAYSKRRSLLWLDKLTYRPRHRLISVSKDALADFDAHVGLRGPADALINFVNPHFLERARVKPSFGSPLRLVAVGNLKEVKNYPLLLEALKELPRDVHLDIYGEGPLQASLERQIEAAKLNVRLPGARPDMSNVLPDYDLFVMPSLYEGCPNAAIEAMAIGLPLLLSDLPVMREISHGNALFFDPHDPPSLAALIRRIMSGKVDTVGMAEKGIELARREFAKDKYLDRLNAIYAEAVGRG